MKPKKRTKYVSYVVSIYSSIAFFIFLTGIFLPRNVSAYIQVPDWLLPKDCCSSVIFLPGLEASRLYKDTSGMFGTTTNKLWEPHRNDNVRDLFLDSNGKSNDPTIYTKDIIDTENVLGINADSIYQTFINTMNELVSEKKINEWKAYPYDWRLDTKSIVEDGIVYKNDVVYLANEVKRIASNSQTKKITIVAHSNGGLVAKALLQELEDEGIIDLVDKVIFVAVPEDGTPEAVAALLHGYDQTLGSGVILTASVARSFGENMEGVYGLIPSKKYFDKISDPIVTFSASTSPAFNFLQNYGSTIDNKDELTDFLLGVDGRNKPLPQDLYTPNVLNSALLTQATSDHDFYDSWQPPSGIDFTEFAGWGMKTLDGISYGTKSHQECPLQGNVLCKDVTTLDPQPLFSFEGDSTVLYPSAFFLNTSGRYFFNLGKYDNDTGKGTEHKDILEAAPILNAISNKITNSSTQDIESEYITKNKPDIASIGQTIELSMHSPASLNLYDKYGNHTGPLPNPDPDSDFELYEAKIPNSYYKPFGDAVYAGFPARDGNVVKIQGTGTGTFTFDVKRLSGDTTISSMEFEDVPVTPLLKADLAISASSTIPTLVIDVNGDGITDVVATSSPSQDPMLFLDILKKTILTFDLSKNVEKQLNQKIDKITRLLNKDRNKRAVIVIRKFTEKLESKEWKQKKLSNDQKSIVTDLLKEFLDELDSN